MTKEKRLRAAMGANALIVALEMVALALSLVNQGIYNFVFYTQDSNYFAMAVSVIFCVYSVRELKGKGKMPDWVHTLRYVSVSCLMVTFFVVLFVLMPMMEENPAAMLYQGSMLYQHTLCPILAVLSFFAFEGRKPLPRGAVGRALIPTLVYAAAAITLNLCRVIAGPYPFLLVYAQPWYMSVAWCVIIFAIAGILAYVIARIYNVIWKRNGGNKR